MSSRDREDQAEVFGVGGGVGVGADPTNEPVSKQKKRKRLPSQNAIMTKILAFVEPPMMQLVATPS